MSGYSYGSVNFAEKKVSLNQPDTCAKKDLRQWKPRYPRTRDHQGNREMKELCCCNCGLDFAMPECRYDKLLDTGDTFYCPNGHAQHFSESRKKEILRLKDIIRQRNNTIDSLYDVIDHLQHVINGYKGAVTKRRKLKAVA